MQRSVPQPPATVRLVRVLGRWDLTCQTVNMIIGSAVYVVPGLTLSHMGGWAPAAVLATFGGVLCIMLTFAEAAGRYLEPGGLYRYAGDAFGEYVGVQIGLLYWVVRVTAAAAVTNVLITYLGEIWPVATRPGWRAGLMTVAILGSAWLNVRGTREAASAVNLLALAKLAPLVVLFVAGLFAISPSKLTATPLPGSTSWARAILLWVFAFGGFEATLIPAGEARDPLRDGPRALVYALTIVALVYSMTQLVVAGTLAADSSGRPVGEAARMVLGNSGAFLMAIGAVLAATGGIAGSIFSTSRITFAIAERGGLPSVLARVHPRFKTPDVSILVFTLPVWLLAISGTFAWNAAISAVGRLLVYAVTSLAVLGLRRRGPSSFQAPVWTHLLAVLFCGWLFVNQTLAEAAAVAAVLAGGSTIWLGYRFWQRHLRRVRPVQAS